MNDYGIPESLLRHMPTIGAYRTAEQRAGTFADMIADRRARAQSVADEIAAVFVGDVCAA